MLYDRFVNSSSLSPVLHQETGSRFFVCSSPPCLLKSTHNLVFNVDSGHSDQQLSFDDIEEEEDGQDEGMSSLVLPFGLFRCRFHSDYHKRLATDY